MQGYEKPKILKLPQGEHRETPRRLPVDIGDVMMNIRMDDSKNKYIGEHISKYAQGLNPYGEFGQPYKVNKNNIRPPIIDPKFYEPLSRMPVKFDAITAGPIVKDLYQKKISIEKVAPKNIMDALCADASTNPSNPNNKNATDMSYREGKIDLHLKQPHASIPYHPSMPVHTLQDVPNLELDGKIITRPQAGIHAPFQVSDQSRDVGNMRTPHHVAVKPGYKDPYTFVQATPEEVTGIEDEVTNIAATSGLAVPTPTVSNLTRDGIDLTPKVQTSAWYNPNYYNLGERPSIGTPDCIDNKIQVAASGTASYTMLDTTHGLSDVNVTTKDRLNTAGQTNVSSSLLEYGELGEVSLPDAIQAGKFDGKANVPHIQEHQEYNRAPETRKKGWFSVENAAQYNSTVRTNQCSRSGIRQKMDIQRPPINLTGLEPPERIIPVGTGRFVFPTV